MNEAETTRGREDNRVLYLGLELGRREWKLGFTTGMGRRPRERVVKAGDIDGLEDEIRRARGRFKLGDDAKVVCCYEAGRDGFCIHRFLEAEDREYKDSTSRPYEPLRLEGGCG